MLQIINGSQIPTDDYYIQHKTDGQHELHFEVSVHDPIYREIQEESRIYESIEKQTYVVKTISGGSNTARIGCQLDFRDWKADIRVDYKKTGTAVELLEGFLPVRWSVSKERDSTEKREISMLGPTPLEFAMQIHDTFGCALRFDTANKIVYVIWQEDIPLSNAYAVDSVNLRSLPEYKGKSTELYTRLLPVGKDGLRIGSVNGGLDYVECHAFTKDVICAVWRDCRYTDAEKLKEDAQKRVNAAARPERSWKLSVVDLHRLNPGKWENMGIELLTKLRLVDNCKGCSTVVQVVEDKVYPYYPERNEITVSTTTGSVQRTLRSLYRQINDPNSAFHQQMDAR